MIEKHLHVLVFEYSMEKPDWAFDLGWKEAKSSMSSRRAQMGQLSNVYFQYQPLVEQKQKQVDFFMTDISVM